MSEEDVCRRCGEEHKPTVDHIVPRQIGGLDERENMQRLCLACHQRKHRPHQHVTQAYYDGLVSYEEFSRAIREAAEAFQEECDAESQVGQALRDECA